jgi:hypothetical protein
MRDQLKLMIFLIFTPMILVGCIYSSNITEDRVLDLREGILITKFHTNRKYVQVMILSEEYAARTEFSVRKEQLGVKAIPKGKAYFQQFSDGFYEAQGDRHYFNIEPATINYVGDCVINWTRRGVQVRIIDMEEETVAEAKKEFPWLFKKYPYKKNLPKIEIDTVEGFDEVDELKRLKNNNKE